MSATNLRPDFRRCGSGKGGSFHCYIPQFGYVTTDPDGETRLLDRTSTAEMGSRPTREEKTWRCNPFKYLPLAWLKPGGQIVNVLLIFVPLGVIAGAIELNATIVFVFNFLAIIPLASLLCLATEELSAKLGPTIGGLVNATFGNAVEMIVSIIALRDNEIRVVQASMLGSMLSNILLVLGCCFLAGGIRYHEQHFNTTVASTMSSLMSVASASLIIPATIYNSVPTADVLDSQKAVLMVSRGTAIVLLILYIMYLIFQLKTHSDLFDEENGQESDQEEVAQTLSQKAAGMTIILVTVMVAICANYLVKSINPFVETARISKTFLGLILIPIIGNAAEHTTAVVVAWKNKMELAIAVAIGSCLQIALFVTPCLVLLGWVMDRPMSLHFGTLETVVFFVSTFVVISLIQDGKSNLLEGALCLGMYSIIALAFFGLPDTSADIGGKVLANATTST